MPVDRPTATLAHGSTPANRSSLPAPVLTQQIADSSSWISSWIEIDSRAALPVIDHAGYEAPTKPTRRRPTDESTAADSPGRRTSESTCRLDPVAAPV